MLRRLMFGCVFLASVITLPFDGKTACAQTVTFESLLDEMIDRQRLARLPEPAYTCAQASSYDRASVAPDQPGWFANLDRSHFVRIEQRDGRTEYVMMDEQGPGAVVRIWATWHGARDQEFSDGTLRFYLDHNPEPAIEGPISSIIDGGGLIEGPLAQGVSPDTTYIQRGHNLYLPIPYAQHCKITYETDAPIDPGARTGEALYYQINYRTYAEGTEVQPFTMELLEQHADKIDAVQERLLESGVDDLDELQQHSFDGPIEAGQSRSIEIVGPGAIRQLTINLEADNLPQALRSTVLEMEFDGRRTVWVPVGEFFGRGYKSQPHTTWYTEVTDEGRMSVFWVMPFERDCKITLINLSDESVEVSEGAAWMGDWTWDERSMHFHGAWYELNRISSFREGATRFEEGAFDVNYVTIEGQGVFVGDTLTIFNGTDAWWGEGDEKIYIDGEDFPSHFGTGTEDYYGYAWCRPEFFDAPFHAQPSGEGNFTPGFTVNSRYRALDAMPFNQSIVFDMEMWHWRNTTINFAPSTFWYARPNADWNVEPDPDTAALPVALERSDVVEVFRAENAIEGEDLEVIEKTGGVLEKQSVMAFNWSNDRQLWWRDGSIGDRLVLEFQAAEAGSYDVVVNLTKANDYGIVEIAVNDNPPQRLDRYHETVANDSISLGTFDLAAGANRLTVEIVGTNPRAVPRHMFGFDYMQLRQD